MDITLDMVDQVRERTGVSYEKAKAVLETTNGSVVDAIIAIEREDVEDSSEITEKIKAAIKKGNVSRIRVSRGGKEIMNVPVNAGIAGGVLSVMAGPTVVLTAAVTGIVAKYGFGCKFEILKSDGSVEEILPDKDEAQRGFEEVDAEECETPVEQEEKTEE